MSHLDVYFRAFKELRKETLDEASCVRKRKAIAQANTEADKLEATKYLVSIQDDWITAIEEGLSFVEKAVAEERQFIRSDGEVVPIEKVKKISKDSVEHLAKHSDMITRLPEEGADVVPDKLYMVEKLSDYAVYENRFLYMMLRYISDFINFRLEKIEALRHTYVGNMHVQKEVVTKKRKLLVQSTVVESRADNRYPVADENTELLIKRIKDCQSIVNSLLGTDLMTQVAKSPMLKPPIVKTNVLKMNNNFKKALALYDYIASYKGAGYTYEEVRYNFAPFSDQIADEVAESLSLISFLAYKFGNGINDVLESEYKKEERRRKNAEAEKLAERLKRLKKRANESNKTFEEYMLVLEERVRMLEKDSEELQTVRQEMDALALRIDELNNEKSELNRRINEFKAVIEQKELELAALNQKYIEDMSALKKEYEREKSELVQAHANREEALKASHAEELAAAESAFANELRERISEHDIKEAELRAELEELNSQWNLTKSKYEQGIADVEARAAVFDGEQQKLADEYEAKLRELEKNYAEEFTARDRENLYIRTELDGLRMKNGDMKPSTDYTSRERFVELEEEFEAFKQFFKGQWKLTKKAIKREVYGKKETNTEPDSVAGEGN